MAVSFFLIIWTCPFLISVVQTLKCPDPNRSALVFADGRCFYIRSFLVTKYRTVDPNWSAAECKLLNDDFYSWYLPQLETETKRDELDAQIDLFATKLWPYWMFWIGLRRDDAEDDDERIDTTKWQDKSKWRWTIDNSSLGRRRSTQRLAPPWARSQPDNYKYVATKDLKNVERCVVATRVSDKTEWSDWPCSVDVQNLGPVDASRFLLVCESINATSKSATNTTEPIRPAAKVKKIDFDWRGVLIGLGVLAAISIFVLIGVWLFAWHRRQKKIKKILKKKEAVVNRIKPKLKNLPPKKTARPKVAMIELGKKSNLPKRSAPKKSSQHSSASSGKSGGTTVQVSTVSSSTSIYFSKVQSSISD